jgi:hypothetical protein
LPIDADFRRLCGLVEKRRAIYDANYRPLRHKVFAHLEAADAAVMSALFAQTNVTELQQLLVFLGSLYEALWQLFFNGRKPVLRPQRYSVSRMRDVPSVRNRRVQERVVQETEQFLRRITGPRDSP